MKPLRGQIGTISGLYNMREWLSRLSSHARWTRGINNYILGTQTRDMVDIVLIIRKWRKLKKEGN